VRWTRRRVEAVTTWVVVVGWVVFYAVALATANQLPPPETAVVQLVVPPLLWMAAIRLVLRHWWSAAGHRMSAMDLPGRLLAAAVAALPERRREWGRAMTAELAEVQGRSARWRFALSSAGATLRLPPAGRLADARAHGRGGRGLGCGGRAGGRRGGARAEGVRGDLHQPRRCDGGPGRRPLAPAAAAAAGAGCDRAGDRWRGRLDRRNRDPPAPGAGRGAVPAAAVGGVSRRRTRRLPVDRPWIATVAGHQPARTPPRRRRRCCVRGLVLAGDPHRRDRAPLPVVLVLAAVPVAAPLAVFFVPAFAAGRAGRSFRSGLQAAVWTVTSIMPLTYAIWLPEGLRRHAIDGHLLDGEVVAPVGANLPEALVFCLGIFPMLGLTLGVIGGALGAGRAIPDDPS
jgi:hypothetical protein